LKNQGLILGPDGKKFSKRSGNGIKPEDIVKTYGADTMRIYEMFMAPFKAASNWDEKGIIGSRRFLERVWRLHEKLDKKAVLSKDTERILNETIKKVGDDIVDFKFNTAISSMMIFSPCQTQTNCSKKSKRGPTRSVTSAISASNCSKSAKAG
jgi:leucyl-tRNA synthetase